MNRAEALLGIVLIVTAMTTAALWAYVPLSDATKHCAETLGGIPFVDKTNRVICLRRDAVIQTPREQQP